jgi:predicted nucleic acid-binding Zn ribbon protein
VRGKPPTRLGEALGSWLDKAGLRRRIDLAQVVDYWGQTVGPQIAAVTRAEAVNAEGTLWVRVTSSAWANELSLMAPRILAKLNQNQRGQIKEIRWLTGLADPEQRHEG